MTSDAAALALKSGNAGFVLRSGGDAYQTAHAIVTALKEGLGNDYYSPRCDSTGGRYQP